jgi:hypothetical protein
LKINYATADFKLGHIRDAEKLTPIATAPRPARAQSLPPPFGDVGAGALSQRLFATEQPIAF